jgi:hypothetical protein
VYEFIYFLHFKYMNTNMNSYYVWIHIFLAVIMYEFIYFLQCKNKRCGRARAASTRREHAARAARAKPELTSCPDQAAPDLCRSVTARIGFSVDSDLHEKSFRRIGSRWWKHHVNFDLCFCFRSFFSHSEWFFCLCKKTASDITLRHCRLKLDLHM